MSLRVPGRVPRTALTICGAAALPTAADWWRLEDSYRLDGVLIADRVVVTLCAPDGAAPAPATPWLPRRSRLVADPGGGPAARGRRPGVRDDPRLRGATRRGRGRCRSCRGRRRGPASGRRAAAAAGRCLPRQPHLGADRRGHRRGTGLVSGAGGWTAAGRAAGHLSYQGACAHLDGRLNRRWNCPWSPSHHSPLAPAACRP